MSYLNSTNLYKKNIILQEDFLKEFFYDIYYNSISIILEEKNKRFLPIHISFNNNKKYQNLFVENLNVLKENKINFICVKEFANKKEHFHIILLEPYEFNLEKKLIKKRKIVNILQFYNVFQYITKEIIINSNKSKEHNLNFYLKKFNFNINNKDLLNFIDNYVKFY